MSWYILASICTVTVAISSILSRAMLKKEESDPIGFSLIFNLLLGIISLIFALMAGRFVMPPIDKLPLQFLSAAILWTFWTIVYFKGVKLLGAGEITILSSLGTFFVVVFGIIFLQERIHFSQLIGVSLIVISSCLIIFEHLSFKSKKGIFLIVLSTLIAGIAVILDTIIIRQYEPISYMAIVSFLVGIVLLLIFPHKLAYIRILSQKTTGLPMILLSFLWSIQAIAYYSALSIGAKISLLSPFVRSSSVITIILAFLFLKEKKYLKRKIAASLITLIGLILLK